MLVMLIAALAGHALVSAVFIYGFYLGMEIARLNIAGFTSTGTESGIICRGGAN